MTEFWESSFQSKQMMWGEKPADCVHDVVALFKEQGVKNVLIPGYGYGRNAKPFIDSGFNVTGIEISQTAIDLAKKHSSNDILIHHGSVSAMPFDDVQYGGIFCYGLIHLLAKEERAKLIKDCCRQLLPGGYMVFVALSKNDASYGQGKELSNNTFLMPYGVTLFYYDADSIKNEFEDYTILEAKEIDESLRKFWQVTCKRN